MTVYALRLENGTDTAARVRMADLLGLAPTGNLSARGGVRPGPTAGVVAVTAGTMQVTVQPFMAYVDGGVSDAQGGYPFVSDSVVTLTLADGHGTLSRTDVICAVVRDSGYDSSGELEAAVEVVQGTAGAGAPTLPTNAVPLRNVVVPAGASAGTGGLTSGALSTDRRQWLASLGGVVTVASQTERDGLDSTVRVVYRTDVDALQARKGANWVTLFGPDVPVALTAGTGTMTVSAHSGLGCIEIDYTTTGAAVGGEVATIPLDYRPTASRHVHVYNYTTGEVHLIRIEADGTFTPSTVDMAAGHRFIGELVYRL